MKEAVKEIYLRLIYLLAAGRFDESPLRDSLLVETDSFEIEIKIKRKYKLKLVSMK